MKNKYLFIGVGVVIVGYLLWKKNKTNIVTETDVVTPQKRLTEQEQLDLFNKAVQVYKGGAKPTDEILENLSKGRDEAYSKIMELKLDAQFRDFIRLKHKTDWKY